MQPSEEVVTRFLQSRERWALVVSSPQVVEEIRFPVIRSNMLTNLSDEPAIRIVADLSRVTNVKSWLPYALIFWGFFSHTLTLWFMSATVRSLSCPATTRVSMNTMDTSLLFLNPSLW